LSFWQYHGHRKNEAYYLHIKFGKEDISYDSKRYSNSYFCNMAADRHLGFCESRTCRVLLTTFSPPKMSPPLGLTNDVGIASYCSESVKLSVRQKSSPQTFDATPAMAVTLMGREHIDNSRRRQRPPEIFTWCGHTRIRVSLIQ